MSLKKILFGLAIVVSTSAFSQKWIDNQVKNEVVKTNKQLSATDAKLVLTTEQTEKVSAIIKEFVLIRSEKGKKIKDKKELWTALKPELKEKNNKISEVLTPEQNDALKAAWRKK
ncbi:peptidoglycan hydrolase CwlO-like protein [Wenyingzhuangia heitensis]|uniref:Peptidoglycan hydrolase CwlO-like protein n=1 Tax=Wenyingzhuangia heitensis TaxID=1487859 RepID=A0ABX0UBG6_9FLAO|nr:hypothetical protein [Wenyingzhuangia heitensis]NIJ45260.1 peptidoglycan hydrolase CwlO-like protein [Wenyingzhuangia heitensis]